MRLTNALVILAASAPLAFAYPKFTVPAAGASVPGGAAITVTWVDNQIAPLISDLTAYQLFLYSGSNTAPQQLYTLATAAFSAGDTVSVTVPLTIGGIGADAYFIGIMASATAGGTITSFSDRFTLTGMTGVFSAAVQAALATVSGTDGPAVINNVAAAGAGAAATVDEGVFGTPYYDQVGTIRYAPMQPVPPTAITATNTAPLFPTSSVSIATTFLPIPSIVTTQTQAQTFSVSSHANTAAPASQPTDDMQRFLNRWKD